MGLASVGGAKVTDHWPFDLVCVGKHGPRRRGAAQTGLLLGGPGEAEKERRCGVATCRAPELNYMPDLAF